MSSWLVLCDSIRTCPAGLAVILCLLNTQSSIVGLLSLFLMHRAKKVPKLKVISSPCDVITVFTETQKPAHTHCVLYYCLRLSEDNNLRC